MAKGSAKALSAMFAKEKNVISFVEGPCNVMIEHVLADPKLFTAEEFAARMDTESKRLQLQVQEYLLQEAKETGCEIEDFSENEEAFYTLGSFQLAFTFPPMKKLGTATRQLVQNKKNWPLLARWIKEWAGASQWSMNEAWKGGPIFEELLAYGTFTMMEEKLDPADKPEFWSDLYFVVNVCFNFTINDLKRAEFIAE